MDRLSELPDSIIHHIMSYLSTKQVCQTSVLSKRWKSLQRSYPIFDFDQNYFVKEEKPVDHGLYCYKGFPVRLKKFIKFIDVSLLEFCQSGLSMQKFRLVISRSYVRRSFSLDKWIGLAVEHQVKELHFEVLANSHALVDKWIGYPLPQTIFSAKFVTTLKLIGCNLEPFDTITWYSLKELTLDKACVDDQMVEKLTSECPLLEYLCLSDCSGLKHLYISKLPKLRTIKVAASSGGVHNSPPESIEIAVTSLQCFSLTLCRGRTRRPVINLSACPHLNKLKFSAVRFITEQDFHDYTSMVHLLMSLDLDCCDLPERVLISSKKLKHLGFRYCNNLRALDVDTPNLLSFKYEHTPIPRTCNINAPCPWMVTLSSAVIHYFEWCLNLRRFLALSSEIEDLNIVVREQYMSFFRLEKFKEIRQSIPCCRVRNLNLSFTASRHELSDNIIVLTGLFSICYPKSLSVQRLNKNKPKLFKWFYDELKNNTRDAKVCNSPRINWWCHYLKGVEVEVEIENLSGGNDRKLLNVDEMMKLHKVDKLRDAWSILPKCILWFHLNWCFPDPLRKAKIHSRNKK